MRSFIILLLAISFSVSGQQRPASALVIEKTYSHSKIPDKLREFVNQHNKAAYFDDVFFNSTLKRVLDDPSFTPKEKVQLFYLMLQRIGYGFSGVSYIPPTLNYFRHHLSIVYVLEKTGKKLQPAKISVDGLLQVMRTEHGTDDLIASNALLLVSILQPDSALVYINRFTDTKTVLASRLPAIFHHNICLAASLVQNEKTSENLSQLVTGLEKEAMIEDALCALYSKPNPLATIEKYILAEENPANDLAIQTALNALAFKVPEETFRGATESMLKNTSMKWKRELLKKIIDKKIPFNYSLSSADALVVKEWDGFTLSQYLNGNLVSIGEFLEFDPN